MASVLENLSSITFYGLKIQDVVRVLERAYYGSFIVKKEEDDPETQEYWDKCAVELSQGRETPVSAEQVKKIWKVGHSKASLALTLLKKEKLEALDSPWLNILTLLDMLPDELQPNHSKQLKDLRKQVETLTVEVKALTAKVESLSAIESTMVKVLEDLDRLKKATGNQTVYVLSDSSVEHESISSTNDSTVDTSAESSVHESASPDSSSDG